MRILELYLTQIDPLLKIMNVVKPFSHFPS